MGSGAEGAGARGCSLGDDFFGARDARAAAETAATRSGAHERLFGLFRPAVRPLNDTKRHEMTLNVANSQPSDH